MDLTVQEDDDLRAVRITHRLTLQAPRTLWSSATGGWGCATTALALAVVEARWTREEAVAEAPIHPQTMEQAIERAFAETRPDVVR